jgi:cell division initiation protein
VKITPLDIRRKEFKRSVRGYSDEEVDIFLDEVADEFERLFQANIDLEDKVHRLQEQTAGYAQVKEALEKTLITAQLQSEEMRANAHKESELILRDAELKARGIINDSYGETQRVQQTLVQLKLLEEDFRFKFRSLLEGYLKLLEEAPLSTASAEAAAAETPAALGSPAVKAAPSAAAPAAAAPSAVKPADTSAATSALTDPADATTMVPVKTSAAATPSAATEIRPAAKEPARAATAMPAEVTPPVVPAAPVRVQAATPAPRPVPSPVPSPGVSPNAPAGPAPVGSRTAVQPGDDDSPTQENQRAVAHVNAAVDAYAAAQGAQAAGVDSSEDVTVETDPSRRGQVADTTDDEDGSGQGFFFGRHFDDFDGTFPPDDAVKNDKARDFEW